MDSHRQNESTSRDALPAAEKIRNPVCGAIREVEDSVACGSARSDRSTARQGRRPVTLG